MTMKFRDVKTALVNILGVDAAGLFKTIGFQRQERSASEFTGNDRLVEVYFKNSNFNRGKGRLTGPVNNDVELAVELTVSAPSKADLTVINNPNSTPAQLQIAIAAFKEASNIADDSIDELFDIVYQINN